MDIRSRYTDLEVVVMCALHSTLPDATRDVVVNASPNGIVWLRGSTRRQADCHTIKALVSDLPGVKSVFCNVATRL